MTAMAIYRYLASVFELVTRWDQDSKAVNRARRALLMHGYSSVREPEPFVSPYESRKTAPLRKPQEGSPTKVALRKSYKVFPVAVLVFAHRPLSGAKTRRGEWQVGTPQI
jgi:hypothetical protein